MPMQAKDSHAEYQKRNAPYVIDPMNSTRLVRNYDLIPVAPPLDNNMILDYIECATAEEASSLRGLLWDAFAAGRLFQKSGWEAEGGK